MFKKLMNKKMLKNEKGLTLIELLAVIVILAIVAAIAIPAIGNIINTQRDKAIVSEMSTIISGAKIGLADGICKADKACTYEDLSPYVEKTKSTAYTATYVSSTKTWSITYTPNQAIKTKKIYELLGEKAEIPANSPVTYTEDIVRKAMGN